MNYDNLFAAFRSANDTKSKPPLPKVSSNQVKISNSNTLIKSFSYHEDKNLKYRQAMEDMSSQHADLTSSNYKYSLFGIYDGHGGSDVVKFIKDRMPELFKQNIKSNSHNNNIENLFKMTFEKIDSELKFFDSEHTGSTATVVLISDNNLYCGNVGDSKAYLITNYKAMQISTDHKCTEESEKNRIINMGGKIEKGRINGQLILSRSLGDMYCKKYGVICEPSFSQNLIDNNVNYCVIASDGVWDEVNDELLFNLSKNINGDADKFCNLIVKNAIDKGSKDNISCIVISFI